MKQLDELIGVIAEYFTGPDAPLSEQGLRIKPGGRFQVRERAERFLKTRKQLGIEGLPTAEHVQQLLRRRLALPPAR